MRKTHSGRQLAGAGLAALSLAFWSPAGAQTDTNSAFPQLKKQQEQLTLENGIAEQQLKKDLARLAAEKQRLELQNGIAQQKLVAEIASLQAELDKAGKHAELAAKQAALKESERKAKQDDDLRADREKLEKLKLANELAAAELADKSRELGQREQELKVRVAEAQAQRAEFDLQLSKLNTEIDLRDKKDLWKNRVNREIQYTREPFKDGVLTISDRRIPLNGAITMDTADYTAERIDYFNNQNREYPIFIVIDRSPGGSVMAGYKILKAMAGSPSPVYVVVKSFAASMAAGITTLSKRSFAYPNAIILHHQILSGSFGNLTEQKENLKDLEEWWKRLSAPVAAKMGLSLDEFIKRMYQNRSSGDWQEFGDGARKLKWVDEIAEVVLEQSYDKNPDAPSGLTGAPRPVRAEAPSGVQERVDAAGRRFVLLPRLDPVDCYYLYNPDNYYRLNP